uniref:Uncharacterized protein n=1 Tax=Anopheles melas TaxID=34690 RepID=A0A182TSI3_9DIPT
MTMSCVSRRYEGFSRYSKQHQFLGTQLRSVSVQAYSGCKSSAATKSKQGFKTPHQDAPRRRKLGQQGTSPLIDVQTAVGLDVSLPCDLLPTTMTMMTDKVYLVIWYKEGNTKPIYSQTLVAYKSP